MRRVSTGFVALAMRTTPIAADAAPTRVKIASNAVTANGCHDNTQTFTSVIPESQNLDTSYQGVLGGIEVVETQANNTHHFGNFVLLDGGRAVSYQLYAKGKGYWISPPHLFHHHGGGGYCHGAAGASEGIDVYAHYK
jgi:hypothetical protein